PPVDSTPLPRTLLQSGRRTGAYLRDDRGIPTFRRQAPENALRLQRIRQRLVRERELDEPRHGGIARAEPRAGRDRHAPHGRARIAESGDDDVGALLAAELSHRLHGDDANLLDGIRTRDPSE